MHGAVRGPYSDYAAPPIYITPDRKKPGVRFSRTELLQLAVAILALSLALTLLFARPYLFGQTSAPLDGLTVGLWLAISVVAVSTGVGLHEIAHKAVAQRYGHWAEFRYNPMGLVLAFVFAAMGFLYGAPGATWINGMVTREQNGRISAAGPLSNIALALLFLGILAALNAVALGGTAVAIVILVANFAAFINLILAGFNMIPVMPLDGAKVWSWNKLAYGAIVGTVVALLALGFLGGLLSIGD